VFLAGRGTMRGQVGRATAAPAWATTHTHHGIRRICGAINRTGTLCPLKYSTHVLVHEMLFEQVVVKPFWIGDINPIHVCMWHPVPDMWRTQG